MVFRENPIDISLGVCLCWTSILGTVHFSLRVILTSIAEVSDFFYNAKSFSHNSSSFAIAEGV